MNLLLQPPEEDDPRDDDQLYQLQDINQPIGIRYRFYYPDNPPGYRVGEWLLTDAWYNLPGGAKDAHFIYDEIKD